MGNHCTRSEPDDNVTRTTFTIGKDYQELEGQTSGEGIKKTISWKATVTRAQLSSKREEFWRTRTSGRRHIWMAIKSAVEADHESSAVLLQMSGITTRNGSISCCVDLNGNVYDIPPFIVNDPIIFPEDKRQRLPPKTPIENENIKIKLRRAGKVGDFDFEVESKNSAKIVKDAYAEKEGICSDTVRLFFGGKELKDEVSLASAFVRDGMVLQVFIKSAA